ncbi:hypothetical protein Ocin01_15917 [Orchesella cincta]|uniref:Uncharacterized protein n=1 Tax=Orchesella cincta TaxID=48709 RepID=A0A1D2MCQ7_ORCCI|nr:hypothetical protein Ocin01_15917 [Orchesella cincta]
MENDSWETNWSVCSSNGMGYTCRMDVSVKGLWIFFVSGWSNESPGLAEFRFQERVGDYQPLAPDVAGKVFCLKQTGEPSDYKTPALTLFYQLELITDSLTRHFDTTGSPDSCSNSLIDTVRSLVINGVERWEIFRRDATSVCIQVENTTSFIPGIVRDTRTLGLDHDRGNVCALVRGCSKPSNEVIRIPNSETSSVLRRD